MIHNFFELKIFYICIKLLLPNGFSNAAAHKSGAKLAIFIFMAKFYSVLVALFFKKYAKNQLNRAGAM